MRVTPETVKQALGYDAALQRETLRDARADIEKNNTIPPEAEKKLGGFVADARDMLSMLKDFYKGAFKPEDIGSLVVAALALVYLFFPIDVIPDPIPGLGFVDDAALLAYAVGVCAKTLKRYREYRAEQKKTAIISADPYAADGSAAKKED
jgi:uncharacterized membrane protein YkvA (DUF1232 family)